MRREANPTYFHSAWVCAKLWIRFCKASSCVRWARCRWACCPQAGAGLSWQNCFDFWKYFCPTGCNWSVRNPSVEDRDLGHHTQSHGVGAIQVNRDLWMVIMIRVDHSVYRVYLQLIINGRNGFPIAQNVLMLMYWRYGEFIVENVDLQSAPLLFLGGNRAHQGWLGPRLLCHVLRNPR